jgi:hypothetical protein
MGRHIEADIPQPMVVARVWAKNAAGDGERQPRVLVLRVVLHVALIVRTTAL